MTIVCFNTANEVFGYFGKWGSRIVVVRDDFRVLWPFKFEWYNFKIFNASTKWIYIFLSCMHKIISLYCDRYKGMDYTQHFGHKRVECCAILTLERAILSERDPQTTKWVDEMLLSFCSLKWCITQRPNTNFIRLGMFQKCKSIQHLKH